MQTRHSSLVTRHSSLVTCVLVILTVSLFAFQAWAACDTYTPSCGSGIQINPVGTNKFKINYGKIGDITPSGLTAMEWKYNVLNAAEQWNTAANGGFLVFDGDTTVELNRASNCTSEQKINLVTIHDHTTTYGACAGSHVALTSSRCDGENWQVAICASSLVNGNPIYRNWSVGETTSGLDLGSVLVHELGHALGLGHSNSSGCTSEKGVMYSTAVTGSFRRRWLYPWDIDCHSTEYGERDLSLGYQQQSHNSDTIGSVVSASPSLYSFGRGAVRWTGSAPSYLSVGLDELIRLRVGSSLYSATHALSLYYASSFYAGWVKELPDRWRIYYNKDVSGGAKYQNDYGNTDVVQINYSHDLTSGSSFNRMYHCTSSSPCSPVEVNSAHPVAMSYDSYSERTLYAWVEQEREGAFDRVVKVAAGHYGTDQYTLNEPTVLPVKSSINVSVACGGQNSAGSGFDCIIAYSPLSSPSYPTRVRRLRVDPFTRVVSWSSETSVGWYTGSSLATWYNNGSYWLAQKASENIQVRKSTNGTSWTHHATIGKSAYSPTVTNVGEAANRETRVYLGQW